MKIRFHYVIFFARVVVPFFAAAIAVDPLAQLSRLNGAEAQSHPKKIRKSTLPKDLASSDEHVFDLSKATFKEILDRYVFIADFSQKEPERTVSQEFLWKYPFKLPPVQFELDIPSNLKDMVFSFKGMGRKAEVFNDGRVAFLSGENQSAHEIWLAGRQEYKEDAATNKIFEFFLGVNALDAYQKKYQEVHGNLEDLALKANQQRVAYFFASTFILRRDVKDERIDQYGPWALYNLAVIYYRFGRMPSVYGAADEGLSQLLKQGKSNHRSEFRQLLAEAHLKNQDAISAVQELDTALRQDPDPVQAARIFNRAGDIYYDLNNYELAEDLYAMASAIDRERKSYNASQALLRAESIFWLGRFDEAAQLFKIAIEFAAKFNGNDWLNNNQTLPWAWLRIGDAFLSKAAKGTKENQKNFLEKARIAYFKTETEYPSSEAAKIAAVRGACLDMPQYQGRNVDHGRHLLAGVKESKDVPPVLMELVWACDAQSYTDRDHSDEMVAKVKEFAEQYPNSRYLDRMIPPVVDVQGSKINEYFAKKQWAHAVDFFEKRRSILFQTVTPELASKLWTAYVSIGRSDKAAEFWPKTDKSLGGDHDRLLQSAFLFEMAGLTKERTFANDRKKLNSQFSSLQSPIQWSKTPTKFDIQLLGRVLVTPVVAEAYPWILKIQDQWTSHDVESFCTVQFPLYSRIMGDAKSASAVKRDVKARVKTFAGKNIEDVKGKDSACFQSWLDLEAKCLGKDDLKSIYNQRKEWPLNGPWLERMWTWSEELQASGHHEEAKKIWEDISSRGPSDQFETKMAKTRLDPNKTELESLWKQ